MSASESSNNDDIQDALRQIKSLARRALEESGIDPEHPDMDVLRQSKPLMAAAVVLGIVPPENDEQPADLFLADAPSPEVLAACRNRGRCLAVAQHIYTIPVANDLTNMGLEPSLPDDDAEALGSLIMLLDDKAKVLPLLTHTSPAVSMPALFEAAQNGASAISVLPKATPAESQWIEEYARLLRLISEEQLG